MIQISLRHFMSQVKSGLRKSRPKTSLGKVFMRPHFVSHVRPNWHTLGLGSRICYRFHHFISKYEVQEMHKLELILENHGLLEHFSMVVSLVSRDMFDQWKRVLQGPVKCGML